MHTASEMSPQSNSPIAAARRASTATLVGAALLALMCGPVFGEQVPEHQLVATERLTSVAGVGSSIRVAELISGGDADSMAEWATRYEHGEGVDKDYVAAVELYCAAARNNHVSAQYQLGWLYANGRGVRQDDRLAAAWFNEAAQADDAHAVKMLVRLGGAEVAGEARCLRPDGTEAMPPVHSVPDPSPQLIAQWVATLSPHYGLRPELVLAVIKAESNFNPRALSPKNAQGLMQLIPATAARFGVSDTWDPVENIKGGMAYLRWLHEHFEGDVALAVAAYNAGEGAVHRYGGIPPYAETQGYVKKVKRLLEAHLSASRTPDLEDRVPPG
ncbi:MAG: transglycosylase SLT domain-containing protein [Gammaproteobacteria bacterium]